MFTLKDKIKELAEYFAEDANTSCFIYKNTKYAPIGVSEVVTCKFRTPNNIEIVYDKWFVECFDEAKAMNLPGIERNEKFVQGTGVTVFAPTKGIFTYYGKDALSIKNACETNRELASYMLKNHNIRQK